MFFKRFVEQQQEIELHHITTMPAAQLIQKEGFKPKSFRLQFEKAVEMTGANAQDQKLIDAVMREYGMSHAIFHRDRNVYFFTNGLKQGFLSDYTTNAEWSPVSEALRSMLDVIKNYYAKIQPEIFKQAEIAQRSLYGQKKVILTIRVPYGILKGKDGQPIDNNSQEEVEMPAEQANRFINTMSISRI